jgi:protein-tyrosine-phosphatase
MPSILFVCTHNRFRSALAEHLLRQLIGSNGGSEGWQISSAGTWADERLGATPEAVQAGLEKGLKLDRHLSRRVAEENLRKADLVVTMESGQKEALLQEFPWLGGRVGVLSEVCGQPLYDIPDPYFTGELPEAIAEEIESLLKENFPRIIRMAESNHRS